MARICCAISEGESAMDKFWQTTQRSSVEIARVWSSRSGVSAACSGWANRSRERTRMSLAWIPTVAGMKIENLVSREESRITRLPDPDSPNRYNISLAFLSGHDSFGRLFQFGYHQIGANAANMLISDPPLGIDEKTFRYAPGAVIDGDLFR